MSLLDVMLRGGVIMWLILICFLVSVAVVVDRILVLRRAGVDYREFMTKFRSLYRRGDPAGVLAFCSQKNVPVANVIRRGILKQGHGQQQVREAIEGAGREEIFRLECRLSFLASIAAVAPMLGFLGTVIGLMNAFHSIDAHGASAGAGTLAGGVWQALLPTAFGLAVGLPVHLFYNYCVSKVGKIYQEVFSSIDSSVRDEYMSKVVPIRSDYVDNPDKENRKVLVRMLNAVLAISTDSDVVKIVTAERKLWTVLLEYWNR